MWPRVLFLLVAAFFLTMNALLWRSEISGRNQPGSLVPVETVWQKVLTAPDHSTLEIRRRGVKIGYCNWAPSIGQNPAAAKSATDDLPEGMVKAPVGYNLDASGNFALDEAAHPRFNFGLKFSTNLSWQELDLRVGLRPNQWELRSRAAERAVTLVVQEDGERFERVITFADLQNPEKLLRELGGPMLPGTLAALGVPLHSGPSPQAALGLHWEARNDWLRIGRSPIRVYRLQLRLLERFQAVAFVSPMGEILRVELPGDVALVNDSVAL